MEITSVDFFALDGISCSDVGLWCDTPPIQVLADERGNNYQVGADVAVGEHDALGKAGRSGREDYDRSLAGVDLRVDEVIQLVRAARQHHVVDGMVHLTFQYLDVIGRVG